jgi:FtsZ-interacting cell division protein ZipA
MDSMQVIIWIMGGAIGTIGLLVGVLWNMTRAEQKAQDEAIAKKADLSKVEDGERRWEKEVDRLRAEHDKVIEKVEGRFEKELAAMETRLGEKIDLILEILRKDKP